MLQNCMIAWSQCKLYINKHVGNTGELGEQKGTLHGRLRERWVAKESKITKRKQKDRWNKSLNIKAEVKL